MKNKVLLFFGLALTFCFGFSFRTVITKKPDTITTKKENTMELGAFSMSLNVKDLSVSRQFYENLGFKVLAGGMEKNYLIMKNGNALIGLFHGMFQGNILTFNPGWDENANNMAQFDDVRDDSKTTENGKHQVNRRGRCEHNRTGIPHAH